MIIKMILSSNDDSSGDDKNLESGFAEVPVAKSRSSACAQAKLAAHLLKQS